MPRSRRSLRIYLVLLGVLIGSPVSHALTLLTYNLAGNGADDWSTNAPQVRAIGRQVMYLQPDVLTFQEAPFQQSYQMTNFVHAFLPGYHIARDSGTDGFIRSVILSRHPIVRSQKWLDGALLTDFGAEARFTRDLFEAEILVPGFAEPLHVFTTHLKAAGDSTSAIRRAAEASAISNFFTTVFLPSFPSRPYLLTGDLNEDIARPPSSSRMPLPRLLNSGTGLYLLTPANPVSGDERTFSARDRLASRFDYVLPCGLLFSNVLASEIFRTDDRVAPPLGVDRADSQTASDHLPVFVEFRNPYEPPLQVIASFSSGGGVTLAWPASPERRYAIEETGDFVKWSLAITNINPAGVNGEWLVPPDNLFQFFRVRETTLLP